MGSTGGWSRRRKQAIQVGAASIVAGPMHKPQRLRLRPAAGYMFVHVPCRAA